MVSHDVEQIGRAVVLSYEGFGDTVETVVFIDTPTPDEPVNVGT